MSPRQSDQRARFDTVARDVLKLTRVPTVTIEGDYDARFEAAKRNRPVSVTVGRDGEIWCAGAIEGDATSCDCFQKDTSNASFCALGQSPPLDTASSVAALEQVRFGGKGTRPVTPRATTAASNASSYGYSRLVLRDGSADVSYRSAVGTYSDSTKVTCH